MRLIGFAIYLGIGAMLHAMFIGATFDWTSAWTFGWLFGWPLMLLLALWGVSLVAACIIGLVFVGYFWIDMIAKWLHARKVRR